jgi:hypothetical protein
MNKKELRAVLLSSAALVLPAVSVIALPSQAAAQTMCSGTADIAEVDISCSDGGDVVVTGATTTNTAVTAGEGLMLVTAGTGSQTTVLLAGPDGNTIATTSNSAGAIETNVTGPIHLIASPINLSTTGNLAFGLDLVSTGGPVSGYIGDIATTGTTAPGARLSAGGGIVDFAIGNVTTSGPTSTAVFAMGTGVYLVVGDITTSGQGSAALLANAGAGDTDVTCGNVSTSGAASRGLSIVGTGSISVDCGNITTSAPNLNLAHGLFIDGGSSPIDVSVGNVSTAAFSSLGVLISGEGSITVETGNVATAGGASDGVNIQGADEDLSVATGNVSTLGATSFGIAITAGTGNVSVDAGNVSTAGTGSRGISINSLSLDEVNLTAGDVSTLGDNSPGIYAFGGFSSFTAETGNVSTAGDNSTAITLATSGPLDFSSGLITTAGANSMGTSIVGFAVDLDIGGITTTGSGSDAAEIFADSLTGSIGDVTASGIGSNGIRLADLVAVDLTVGDVTAWGRALNIVADGTVTLATGNITGREAMVVDSDSTIDIQTGDILTTGFAGFRGIVIQGGLGGISLATGDITNILGDSTTMVDITSLGGVTTDLGDITARGPLMTGILIANGGAGNRITAGFGDISMTGPNSRGVVVTAGGNFVVLDGGNVATTGAAVQVTGATVSGSVGNLATTSDNAPGLLVNATGLVDVTCGNVSTTGQDSPAVRINSPSVIDVQCGDLTTTGGNFSGGSQGLFIAGGGGAITATVGNVSTANATNDAVHITGSGAITLTTQNVTTDSYAAEAISIVGGAEAIDVTCGNILVQEQNSNGVVISGTGAIDLRCGSFTNSYTGDSTQSLLLDITGGGGAIGVTVGNVTQNSNGGHTIDISGTGPITLNAGNVTNNGTTLGFSPIASGVVISGGTGAINATLGSVTTTGEFATGVNVTGTGPITVNTGAITTNDNEASGVIITGGAGAINLTTGTILAQGQDLFGVRVIGTGPITTTTGAITTTEPSSTGLWIGGGAGLVTANFSNIDTLNSGRPALRISSTGAIVLNGGSATLRTNANNSTTAQITGGSISGGIGNVIAGGGNSVGLSATATGAINLTIGGATTTGNAIAATSTGGGAITLNLTGNVASSGGVGVYTNTNAPGAIATITIAPGTTVTGSTGAIGLDGLGSAVVNNSGTIGTAGGLAVWTQVGVPVTINSFAGATLNGRVDLSHGADSIINSGTWNVSGLNDFLNGSDLVSNLVGGVINVAANTSIARLETLTNAGTMNVNGSMTFSVVAPNFTNSGTFNLGAGSAVSGIDFFANSGTIVATGGTASIGTTFGVSNSGLITMVDGAANDVLTINGLYGGTGAGTLAIDVVGTAAGNTADLLRVTGTIASGPTLIIPNFITPAIDPDGVLVVDGGGNIAANAFTLGGVTSQGLINYSLITQGNDVFLATAANAAVFDVGLVGSINQDMWYQSADAYLACAASRRNELGADRKSPVSICGQLYFGRDRYGDRNHTAMLFGDTLTYSDRVSTHRRGAQLDLGARASSKLRFGLTAGYAHAEARLATGSDLDLEGHNVGAYAQYGGERGVYAGLMVKRDRYDARFANPAISAVKIDAKSTGIDGEIGWRLRGFGGLVDLNAGLSHVRSKLDDFTAGNITFDSGAATSLRGRFGTRLAWSGDWAPFVAATAFHEFKGDDDIVLTSGTSSDSFGRRGRGTWARLEGGLGGGAAGGPLLSVWGDFGDVKGWGLRAGFRF